MSQQSETKAILVCRTTDIDMELKGILEFKKPQVIHVYQYDFHFLFSQLNLMTTVYYLKRFKIDYFALSVPLTKDIQNAKRIIGYIKKELPEIKILCTGEAITRDIAYDIGADRYTKDGDDIAVLLESLDKT